MISHLKLDSEKEPVWWSHLGGDSEGVKNDDGEVEDMAYLRSTMMYFSYTHYLVSLVWVQILVV